MTPSGKPAVTTQQSARPEVVSEKPATAAPVVEHPVQAPAPAPVAPAEPVVPSISQLKDKIMANTETTDFAAKTKDAAADLQTRVQSAAQTAYTKGAEATSEMTDFAKGNYEALVTSSQIFAAGLQDISRSAVEEVKTAAESVTADMKRMVAVQSPTELFQLQGEIARRNLDAIVARTSKNAELLTKLATDMFAPLSTRASVAMERLNKAA